MISGKTQVLGVIGHPVEHTFSPVMHNAALKAMGMNSVYLAFHVLPEFLREAVAGMRALQVRGLNVTVPHKLGVVEWLDEISAEARAIGAVNTIDNRDGRLKGYNTDAFGAMESLRRQGGLEELPPLVVLLGAGGAARAILYGLLQQNEVEEILVLNRTVEKAEGLARDLDPGGRRVRVGALEPGQQARIRDAGLLINSTSVGMHPHEGVSPLVGRGSLRAGMVVLDIVYNPLRTRLMEEAEAAKGRALNGLGMLVYQGARSFEIWTGKKPPVEVMMEVALQRFGGMVE